MAGTDTRTQPPGSPAVDDLLTPLMGAAWAAQSVQWEALLAWQRSVAELQRDLWDQWACRFGGGAPFDA